MYVRLSHELRALSVNSELFMFQVVLPSCELVLAARDDAAEFDDGREQQNFKDDPR